MAKKTYTDLGGKIYSDDMPEPKPAKVKKVMHEFKEGELHSGSDKGPKVKNRKQAVAIALSEGRKAAKK